MEWVLKAAGLAVVMLSCTLAGFCMSAKLERRARLLRELDAGMQELYERIRCGGGELDRLLAASFPDSSVIRVIGDTAEATGYGLNGGDVKLLSEFFSRLGASESEGECSRIELYRSLMANRCRAAEEDAARLCRLWRTMGFCGGLLVCIFLI